MPQPIDFDRYRTLTFKWRDRVLIVTINRAAHLNSINQDLHEELAQVFYDVNRDPDSDVVVITGAGKAFCAGGDMDWLQSMIDDPELFRSIAPDAKQIVFGLLELEKPIICKLNGPAAGLGATLALLCDIVIASEQASIGDPHVKIGIVAGDGGAVIWPQLIGYARAKEFLMTGDMIDASQAKEIGLINHVVPADQLEAKVMELADKLAAGATQAIRYTKTVTNIPLREIAHKVMDASLGYELLTNATRDHQEAINAFREKREPVFEGI